MAKLNAEFMRALNDIAEQKGIDKEIVLEALEAGLVSAYKKNYNTANENFCCKKVIEAVTIVERINDVRSVWKRWWPLTV